MNRDDIVLLFRYDRWAWNRVLAQAAGVSAEQYAALAPVPHGSLCGTLVHAMAAAILWRQRWQGESPTTLLREADVPTFAELRQRWEAEAQALHEVVGRLADDDLNAVVHYRTTKGVPMENVFWHLLLHVVNHGTQHRSEAAMLLTTFGQSPGDLDLITFLRQMS